MYIGQIFLIEYTGGVYLASGSRWWIRVGVYSTALDIFTKLNGYI